MKLRDCPPPDPPEPGWYPDPLGMWAERQWNGKKWTQYSRGGSTAEGKSSREDKTSTSKLGLPAVDGMGKVLASVKGQNGELIIGEHALVINRGAKGALLGGHRGKKLIPYKSISAVQLKTPGATVGFIQFTIPGGNEKTKGARRAMRDENAITFNTWKRAEFEEARDFIQAKISRG